MSEKRNVPELRFQDFQGEWFFEKVQNQFELISGQHLNPDEYSEDKAETSLTPYFTGPSDFTTKETHLTKWARKLTKTSRSEDLLFTVKGSGVGTMMIQTFPEIAIGRQLMAFRKAKGNTRFLFHRLQPLKNYFVALASGNMIPGLTREDLLSVKIFFPPLPEQQKIAEFLTAVDRRVELFQTKKEKLEAYKKGVMQQIFSQKLRFKADDGSDFPDWEEKKLGEICKITTGKLDANAMVPDGEYRFYTCAREFYRIDKYAFDTEALLISGNGANVGYVHYYKGKFNAYQRTYVLTELAGEFLFVKYFLDENLHKRIHSEKKDGNTPYIVMGTLTDMTLNIPVRDEQKKIVQFLTSLDRSIENLNQQITHTQTWKKGLLQKMFV